MNNMLECNPYKNELYYKLKNRGLVQSALINTILTRYNCKIDALALILHMDVNKLDSAWKEQGLLSEKEASDLVYLFYSLLGEPDKDYLI